jgi:hypothetical protein
MAGWPAKNVVARKTVFYLEVVPGIFSLAQAFYAWEVGERNP